LIDWSDEWFYWFVWMVWCFGWINCLLNRLHVISISDYTLDYWLKWCVIEKWMIGLIRVLDCLNLEIELHVGLLDWLILNWLDDWWILWNWKNWITIGLNWKNNNFIIITIMKFSKLKRIDKSCSSNSGHTSLSKSIMVYSVN
jgi:hypothetical protein